MAGASKKSKRPADPESADGNASDESGSYDGPQEVQATFEGRNPEGHDFHGIKQLLHQLFLTEHLDLSQVSDMLISQAGVGSVLKQSCNDSDDEEDIDMVEESDVFGITSVINLTSHRETPCVQQLYKLVDEESTKHADIATKANFSEILGKTNKLGLLINERFLNIPAKISALMLTSLQDEINRIKKKDNSYNFDYYIMLCKLWRPKGSPEGEVQFSNDEEELFAQKADFSFEYSVATQSDTGLTGKWGSEDKELIPYRRVILFKADKLEGILNQVTVFVQT